MYLQRFLGLAALAIVAVAAHGAALAQAGSTRIVIAFPPGGPVDFVGRVLAEGLARELGHTVLVDNKPGANGGVAAQFVARATPDGSTLWLTSVGAIAINPSLYEALTYDVQRDFAPVSLVVNNNELLVVNPANPATNAIEFVAAARAKKEPTAMASSGIGSVPHLAMELLAEASKTSLLHVPYKGAAPAITDVMAGQVAAFFGDIPGLIGHIKGGKLKAIGIAAPTRHPLLPEVRTLDEQGLRGVDSNNWYGLMAPAGTPPARIEALNAAVRRVLGTEQVRARLAASGAEPAASSPAELGAMIKADTAKWAKIIRDKKIKGE